MFSSKFYHNPDEDNVTHISRYKGKIVIIDAMNRIYKQIIGALQMNKNDPNIHIKVIFDFTVGLIKYGMIPVYVFDGKSPKEKIKIVNRRKRVRVFHTYKCKTMNIASDEYVHSLKKAFVLTKKHIDDCKKVLDYMGICYIDAPAEADQQCAILARYYKNNVAGVITDDFDVLLHGAPVMLKNFSFKNKTVNEINNEKILSFLSDKARQIRKIFGQSAIKNLTHENFVEFGVLNSTDYEIDNSNLDINNLTQDDLFKIFAVCDFSVAKVCDILYEIRVIQSKKTFLDTWIKIKDMYVNSKVTNPELIHVILTRIQYENLIKFLCTDNNLNLQYVQKELDKMKQNYEILQMMYNKKNVYEFSNYTSYQFRYYTKVYMRQFNPDSYR